MESETSSPYNVTSVWFGKNNQAKIQSANAQLLNDKAKLAIIFSFLSTLSFPVCPYLYVVPPSRSHFLH